MSTRPGGTIVYPGGQQKELLPFGHGSDLVAFNGTAWLIVKVFSGLGRDKQGLNPFGTC